MTTTDLEQCPQLLALAQPFPQRVIQQKPGGGGGSYVPHHLYVQRLLLHLHHYDLSFVREIRGYVPAKPATHNAAEKPALENAVVGVVLRLECVIDGTEVKIEEVGDCENPHNWPGDGSRLKDAWSDAVKRCCARIGLGTHLYARTSEEYVLYEALKRQIASASPGGGEGGAAPVDHSVGSSESEERAGVNGSVAEASPPSEPIPVPYVNHPAVPDVSPAPPEGWTQAQRDALDAETTEDLLTLVRSALANAGPHTATVSRWAKAQGWPAPSPPTVGDANALLDFIAELEEVE